MKKIRLNKSYIGAEIRGLRAKFNIDQKDFAEKLNMDLIKIKKIENGFKMPNLKEIVDICNFFHIKIKDFMKYNEIWFAK